MQVIEMMEIQSHLWKPWSIKHKCFFTIFHLQFFKVVWNKKLVKNVIGSVNVIANFIRIMHKMSNPLCGSMLIIEQITLIWDRNSGRKVRVMSCYGVAEDTVMKKAVTCSIFYTLDQSEILFTFSDSVNQIA